MDRIELYDLLIKNRCNGIADSMDMALDFVALHESNIALGKLDVPARCEND